jgi:hypothetical protein
MTRPVDPAENLFVLAILFLLLIPISIMTYASPCSFILGQTVAEKENKMRETLRIMSLGRVSYMLANFATEAVHACISSIILFYGYMLPMWLSPTYENSTLYQEYPYVLLIALIFNGLSLVSLSLLISTFLFDSKVAS